MTLFEKKLDVLVVEDNEEYSEAAKKYLASQKKIKADFAQDYDSGISKLNSKKYSGIVTDLFFPKKIGDNDIKFGKEAVFNLILELGDDNKSLIASLEKWKKYVGTEKFPEVPDFFGDIHETLWCGKKLYSAMEEDASNQPLGILIAKNAVEKSIPCVIATSTYHHNKLAQLPYLYHCKLYRENKNKEIIHFVDNTLFGSGGDGDNPFLKGEEKYWKEVFGYLLKEKNDK